MKKLAEYRLVSPWEMNIVVLPELESYIEPLQSKEYEDLERSIITDRCRDNLICWEQNPDEFVLVDGHNRFSICKKHRIRFHLSVYEFENIDEVKSWMLENQLSRRNLTDAQRDYYLGKLYAKAKAQHGGDRKSKVHNELLEDDEPNHQGFREDMNRAFGKMGNRSAVETLAEKENVSISTLKRNEEFAEAVDAISAEAPAVKAKILKSNLPKKTIIEVAKPENLPMLKEHLSNKSDASKFVEGLKTFKHLKKNDDEPQAIQTPLVVKIDSVEDLEIPDNQATKEVLLSQVVELQKEVDLQKRLRDDQAKNTKEYMDLASERFHKIKELEAELKEIEAENNHFREKDFSRDLLIKSKVSFDEDDFKNPEIQSEWLGLYSEMPFPQQLDYVAIPKNQYYYFRGFIDYVISNRQREIEDIERVNAMTQALMEENSILRALVEKNKQVNKQIPDNQ